MCEEYCLKFKENYVSYDLWLQHKENRELPDCQFRGNKSEIQRLLKKGHIDSDGILTEVQFVT